MLVHAWYRYKDKQEAGTGLISSSRETDLVSCENACAAAGSICQAISFTGETKKEAFMKKFKFSFFALPNNCKLWSEKSGRRARGVQPRATDDDVVHQEKEEPDNYPVSLYHHLPANENQHHSGMTLRWTTASDSTDCREECDRTVKCQGVSFYSNINTGDNCRLVGDSMVRGPWINAADGPWSAAYQTMLTTVTTECNGVVQTEENGLDVGSDAWRWDEDVEIESFTKVADLSVKPDLYETVVRSSDDVFAGETLGWVDLDTEEECMAECTKQNECQGISFYSEDDGLDGLRCRLAASEMTEYDTSAAAVAQYGPQGKKNWLPTPGSGRALWLAEAETRANEPNGDVRWLRHRGYTADEARTALDAGAGATGQESKHISIAQLCTRQPVDGGSVSPDIAVALKTERKMERRILKEFYGEDVFIALEGEDIAVVVPGFKPPSPDAPPLVVEIYIDVIAERGYPGDEIPLIAVKGGGLLEDEIWTITTGLVEIAEDNIDIGTFIGDLIWFANNTAKELIDARIVPGNCLDVCTLRYLLHCWLLLGRSWCNCYRFCIVWLNVALKGASV
jgi:hypothetical protein